jgi:tetratricopeptide (TPR) repeat protein
MYVALGSLSRTRTRATPRTATAMPKPVAEPKRKKADTESSRRRVKKTPAPDPAAEKLYLRGRAQWNKRHPDALRQAITLFHEAIDIDPMHANSHAGLADAYAILGVLQVVAPRDILPKARASALRAIELAPELAEPHASLGYVAGIFDWDWPTAERELREAMRLNPRYPWAPHWYGLLAMSKSLDDALEYVKRARDLDPLSPFLATAVGIIHHIRRENSAALRVYSQLLDAEEAFAPGHYYLGLTYEQMGRYEEATEHLRRAAAMGSRGSLFAGALGHCYAVSGRSELAREVLLGMAEEDQHRYVSPYNRLLIHVGLGDQKETLLWLERSLEDRSCWLWFMRADSRFDPIRNDSRCRELVAKHGLEP